MRRTSLLGLYGAGDLSTAMQGATVATAAGGVAGAMINHDLNLAPHGPH